MLVLRPGKDVTLKPGRLASIHKTATSLAPSVWGQPRSVFVQGRGRLVVRTAMFDDKVVTHRHSCFLQFAG
jgi:hypothetical protein